LLALSFLGRPRGQGKFDDARAELRKGDAGDPAASGRRLASVMPGIGVDLENERLVCAERRTSTRE
jgi:hypothetical protein